MINLEKFEERKQKVSNITLTKFKIPTQKAQVLFYIDCSGSMHYMYTNGEVQEVFERILPIAAILDDNGQMQVAAFEEELYACEEIATVDNAENYISRNIDCMGGTCYEPIISDAIDLAKSEIPTLAIIITDGDNSDKEETTKAIKRSWGKNVFFQFVGIGNSTFKYLRNLDDLKGKEDNVDFFPVKDISCLSDEELYSLLLNEFPKWLNSPKKEKGFFKRLFNK